MNNAYVKNLHPFYKPDDDDENFDINSMLFGDETQSGSASNEDLFAVPEIEGINDLTGSDLDSALAALLEADEKDSLGSDPFLSGESDGDETPPAVMDETRLNSLLEDIAAGESKLISSTPAADTPPPAVKITTEAAAEDSPSAADVLFKDEDTAAVTPAASDVSISSADSVPAFDEASDDVSPADVLFTDDTPAETTAEREAAIETLPEEASADSGGGADIDELLSMLGSGDDTQSLSGAASEQQEPEAAPFTETTAYAPPASVPEEDDFDEWSEFAFDPTAADEPAVEKDENGVELVSQAAVKKTRGKKEPVKKRLAAISVSKFIAASIIIFMLILGSGAGVVFGIRQVYANRIEQAIATAHLIMLSLPQNVANQSNFVTVNEKITVGGSEFFLRRMSVSNRGTFFHFEDNIRTDDYTFILKDQYDNFVMRVTQDFDYDTNVLQFASVRPGIRYLTLSVQPTGQSITEEFNFVFVNGLNFPTEVHINYPVPLMPEVEDRFLITGIFSSTGSEFFYMVQTDPQGGAIVFDWDGISMREGARNPVPYTPEPAEFNFPELDWKIGRIAFGPVRNLDAGAMLSFSDVFVSYPLPAGSPIDIVGLFRDEPQYEQWINLREHSLILERMGAQGPFVILVFHAIDDFGQRVRAEIDANLIIYTEDGMITIPGQNFFSETHIGTDLFFDTRPYGLSVINASDLRLDVTGVQMRMAEATLNLYFEDKDLGPWNSRLAAEKNIEYAFGRRLAFRSGKIPYYAIRGFSQDVLNNRAVMRHYTPVTMPGGETNAVYDVSIVAGGFPKPGLFLAIVEEEWLLDDGGVFTSVRNTHQVAAQLIEDNWIIISNRIVS